MPLFVVHQVPTFQVQGAGHAWTSVGHGSAANVGHSSCRPKGNLEKNGPPGWKNYGHIYHGDYGSPELTELTLDI